MQLYTYIDQNLAYVAVAAFIVNIITISVSAGVIFVNDTVLRGWIMVAIAVWWLLTLIVALVAPYKNLSLRALEFEPRPRYRYEYNRVWVFSTGAAIAVIAMIVLAVLGAIPFFLVWLDAVPRPPPPGGSPLTAPFVVSATVYLLALVAILVPCGVARSRPSTVDGYLGSRFEAEFQKRVHYQRDSSRDGEFLFT